MYCSFAQGNQSISRLEERGEVVLVVEKRTREDGKEGQVILRVRLISSLHYVGNCNFYFPGE